MVQTLTSCHFFQIATIFLLLLPASLPAQPSSSADLIFSTWIGGPNYDRAYAIEVDRQGFVYVGGRAGDSLPTTPGVLQERFAGDLAPNRTYGRQMDLSRRSLPMARASSGRPISDRMISASSAISISTPPETSTASSPTPPVRTHM